MNLPIFNKEKEYIEQKFENYTIVGNLMGSSAAKLFIIEKNNSKKVVKIAITKGIDNGNEKLKDEIYFLEQMENQNSFIKVLDKGVEGEIVWYTMEYLNNYLTIKELIERKEKCSQLFTEIIQFMFSSLYSPYQVVVNRESSSFNRVEKRLEQAIALDVNFKDIISSDYIEINGQKYSNYKKIFPLLREQLSSELSHEIACLLHKDLSIENILVSDDLSDFKLIDPRGAKNENEYEDYLYDIGKVCYTLNGFTEIKYGKFNLLEIGNLQYEFSIENVSLKYYSDFINVLNIMIPKYFSNDHKWMNRLTFIEACHYLANVPCFLDNGEQSIKALALYLQGIIILNNLFEKIGRKEVV